MAMPIRRRNNNDPDWMARLQDEELKSLEKRISALYDEANTELTEEFNRFYESFREEQEIRLGMVESGEITEADYQRWCRNQIFQSNQYQATLRSLTDVLVNSDVAAMALVNDQLPLTLAESYDFISSLGFEAADQAGISMGTFQIYNADSVQAIIRDNPDLLPVVDLPEDELWNRNHINNQITQAIIRGDTIPQIARRLQNVAQMDNNAAIRNARTSMTAAENLGRSESARRLKQKGIPVEEVWSATHDSRTRDTHLLLDGTKKDENGFYGADILAVPLRFPADPNGEPQEIYNCRCRENVQIEGIDHSKDDELYEQFMREQHPEDWEAIQKRREDLTTGEGRRWQERQDALARQQRLREERQASIPKGYADANDLERAIMADGGSLTDPRLLAYSNTLEEESKYNASLKNNLEQAIQESGYTDGIRSALEAEESDAQNYLDNLPEFKTPEQIATAQAMEERLRILSSLKPSQENVIAPVSMQNADIPEGARRALDAFERRNQNKAKEYSMVVDGSGNIIGEAGGRARSTALTQGENIASEGNYHIHNHPIENIIYSDQDIINYERYGVRGGIVITRDGTEYQLINSNPISRYDELERLRGEVLYGDMTEEEYSRRYRELMPFSSSVTGAFNNIETEWREERRATLDRIYAELPLPSDRNERIAVMDERDRRYNAWVESVGNDNDRKIRWLEENASRYGFTFIRRRIT